MVEIKAVLVGKLVSMRAVAADSAALTAVNWCATPALPGG